MRILYVITQADGGGAQRYVLSLAKHFGGAIAAGTEDAQLFDQAKELGLQTFPLTHLKRNIQPWHDLLAIRQIYRLLRSERPDIVHLNSTKAGLLGSVAGRLAGTKVIFTAHGFRFLEPLSRFSRIFYLAVEKVASEFRDYIIAVSEADRISAVEKKIIAANKISTIHNGISQHNFLSKEEARKKLSLPQDKFIFGTIANFYYTKGLDVLVRAIVQTKHTKALWAIIGYGNEDIKQNLEQLISQNNLSSRVTLLGKIPEGFNYLKAFDAYVLPSRKEGFPYALLDAMQAGLPILATKVGGVPEALGDAGLLIDPENPQAMSSALDNLYENQNLRTELAAKSMFRSKLFTEKKLLEETQKIYETILKG